MKALLSLAALAAGAVALPAQNVSFVRSILPQEGENIDMQVADFDGDGLLDLFVAVRRDGGGREILIYRQRPDGAFASTPDQTIEVKREVVCWGFGEFRPQDPGIELLFTTRSAAYTFSPRSASYRDNLQEFARGEFLLDLPSERELLEWMQIRDLDGDGVAEVALATVRGFLVVRVDGTIVGEIPLRLEEEQRPAAERALLVPGSAAATLGAQPLADLMVPDDDPGVTDPPPMLHAEEWLPLPHLEDADGDGRLDLIYYQRNGAPGETGILVHYLRPQDDGALRYAPAPDRVLAVDPGEDWDLNALDLAQVGGGPAVDLLFTRSESANNLTFDWQFLLFFDPLRPDGGLGRPDSIVTVEATVASAMLVDLDRRGRKDLGVSAWSLELQTLGLEGVNIAHGVTVYPQDERGFAAQAACSYRREYDADSFTAFALVPPLSGDLDGDGFTDLLEPAADGTLEVRPLRRRDGVLSFADGAWRPSQTMAPTAVVNLLYPNGDRVHDPRIAHRLRREVEMLVSKRP